MKLKLAFAAAAALSLAMQTAAVAQTPPPSEAIVSIYRAAPGHQVMLLKWFEQQERVAAAAGVPPNRLYVHQNGDHWDYLIIAPMTTPAQDQALEAAAKQLGVPSGPGVGIELRKHVAYHTDTLAIGPMNVSEYLRMIGQ